MATKPIIHGRDHGPGGADQTPPSEIREMLATTGGTETTVVFNVVTKISFGAKTNGSDILDLTDPTEPVYPAKGVYAVAINVTPAAMTIGSYFNLSLRLDVDGDDAFTGASSPPATAAQDQPSMSLTLVYFVPAGGKMKALVLNEDGTSRAFGMNTAIQRIS